MQQPQVPSGLSTSAPPAQRPRTVFRPSLSNSRKSSPKGPQPLKSPAMPPPLQSPALVPMQSPLSQPQRSPAGLPQKRQLGESETQFDMDLDEGSMLPPPAQQPHRGSSTIHIQGSTSSQRAGTSQATDGFIAPPPARSKSVGSSKASQRDTSERVLKIPRRSRSGSCARPRPRPPPAPPPPPPDAPYSTPTPHARPSLLPAPSPPGRRLPELPPPPRTPHPAPRTSTHHTPHTPYSRPHPEQEHASLDLAQVVAQAGSDQGLWVDLAHRAPRGRGTPPAAPTPTLTLHPDH